MRPLMIAAVLLLVGCRSTADVEPPAGRTATGGWSLIAPPFSSFEDSSRSGGLRVLDEAPLGQWSLIARFDNAHDCERSRQETIRFLTREDQNPTFSQGGAMLNRSRAMLSRCVPSDDPRLK